MVELVEGRLGVTLFWLSPDELDRDIDAACVCTPSASILLNLVGGAECWWRTRMTLAHELCHLLFDLERAPAGSAGSPFLFSPHRGDAPKKAHPPIQLPGHLETVERRANVFAAHFLAPSAGIKAVVGQKSPTSEEAIDEICRHFQIGRVTAINQLKHIYNLSKDQRYGMLTRTSAALPPREHPDAAVRPGLRTGLLQDLVARALAAGRIGKSRARQFLALSHAALLPPAPGLTPQQRAPLYEQKRLALLAAQHYLDGRRDLAECFPVRVTPEGDRFRVELGYADEVNFPAPRPGGYLILAATLEVLEQESRVEVKARQASR